MNNTNLILLPTGPPSLIATTHASLANQPPQRPTWLQDLIKVLKGQIVFPDVPDCSFQASWPFHCFTRLSFELQDEIWGIAATEAQIVEIDCNGRGRLQSETPAPAVLHACSRSRRAALNIYEKLYLYERFTGTYVNWANDEFFFNVERGNWPLDLRPADISILSEIGQKCRGVILRKIATFQYLTRSFKLEALERVVFFQGLDHYSLDVASSVFNGNLHLLPIVQSDFDNHEDQILQMSMQHDAAEVSNYFNSMDEFPELGRDMKIAGLNLPEDQVENIEDLVRYTNNARISHPTIQSIRALNARRDSYKSRFTYKHAQKWGALQVPPQRYNFKNWRISELRQEAEIRGLDGRGSRQQLIDRLEPTETDRLGSAIEEYEWKLRLLDGLA